MEKLKMHSPDITEQNIARITELFPNCVTEAEDANGKHTKAIDFDLLKQELSDSIVDGPRERYHLDWPGKRAALLAANAPIAKTLRPLIEESVDFDRTNNLFIEGENLDALKLLQEMYLDRVKLIYIDPPYNTGKQFIYDDDFQVESSEYLVKSHQSSPDGNRMIANTESNGRFHSDWLTMMFSRLKLCRNLLRDDGVVFISIDDHEVSNLRRVCDEVFGAEQFVSQIIIQSNKRGQTYKQVAKTHEYLLIYSKTDNLTLNELQKASDALPHTDSKGGYELWELRNRNPKFGRFNRPNLYFPIYVDPTDQDESGYSKVTLERKSSECIEVYPKNSQGTDGCWRWGKEKIAGSELDGNTPVLIGKRRRDGGWNIYEKSRKATTKAKSIWTDNGVISEQGTIELGSLGLQGIFDHPKPLDLLERCVRLGTDPGDLVLDFFAGSGTTAHAVMKLNAEDGGERRFIMVQVPEDCPEESQARELGYNNIADLCKERIRRAGQKIKEENATIAPNLDVGFRVLKVDTSNMKDVYYRPDDVDQSDLLDHIENIKEDRTPEDLLFQVLLDWGVDLSLPIKEEEIEGKTVFFVDENALGACFDKDLSEELVKKLAERKPLRAVFRDSGYKTDSVKINVEQIFRLLSPSTEVKSI